MKKTPLFSSAQGRAIALCGVALTAMLVAPVTVTAAQSEGGFGVKATNVKEDLEAVRGFPGKGVAVPIAPGPVAEPEVSNVIRAASGRITVGSGRTTNDTALALNFDIAKVNDTRYGDNVWADLQKLIGPDYVAVTPDQLNPTNFEFRYLMKETGFGSNSLGRHNFEVSFLNASDQIVYTTHTHALSSAGASSIHRSYSIATKEPVAFGRVQVTNLNFSGIAPQKFRDLMASPGSKVMVSYDGVDLILPLNENIRVVNSGF
jgi:hypothetical protein